MRTEGRIRSHAASARLIVRCILYAHCTVVRIFDEAHVAHAYSLEITVSIKTYSVGNTPDRLPVYLLLLQGGGGHWPSPGSTRLMNIAGHKFFVLPDIKR